MTIRDQSDIPTSYKGTRRPLLQDGARIRITPHARLRYWQRVASGRSDEEIRHEAAAALRRGDPRFRFRAYVYDNPHRPTLVVLVTVLGPSTSPRPFVVDLFFERDEKWHDHLRRTT